MNKPVAAGFSPEDTQALLIAAEKDPEGVAQWIVQKHALEPEKTVARFPELLDPDPWVPQYGPQAEAYHSKADLLLYGGAAGGGKSDLILGWAINRAQRSVIFRQKFTDMTGLTDRLLEIVGTDKGYNDAKKRYQPGGSRAKKLIEFGYLERPRSELGWQGRPHDFIGFDEGAQIDPRKVHFVLGWLRSATGARCRAIIGSNPPLGGEGDYLIEWFAPWLDPLYPDPATPGELRWCVTDGMGKPIWVDGPGLYEVEGAPEPVPAQSRTFIPSLLDDNKYLRDTGYRSQVLNMPEPLRTALLTGNFLSARLDHEYQVLPTDWVNRAVERWERFMARAPKLPDMLVMGVDVAQGGMDRSVLACIHDDYCAPLITYPGKVTHDGITLASRIMEHRRNNAGVCIDMGGGWGGSTRDFLRSHHRVEPIPYVGGGKSVGRQAGGGGMGFTNKRAESYWRLREALDPAGAPTFMLPPDKELIAELTSLRWIPQGNNIKAEPKEDQIERLGRSPDKADAVVMAFWARKRAGLQKVNQAAIRGEKIAGKDYDTADDYDPFKEL